MSGKRPGWRSQERTYNYLTRDLQRKAAEERAANRFRRPLELCLKEIEEFHHTAYPKCQGGCPAHEAMAAARTALGIKDPRPEGVPR